MCAMFGCSRRPPKDPLTQDPDSLGVWCSKIYSTEPVHAELLRHEEDRFLFTICMTREGWLGLYYKDKRDVRGKGLWSNAYFMKDGDRLPPAVGDAGDGRIEGAKFLKTSQEYDSLMFEYQVDELPVDRVIFRHVSGRWFAPE